MRKYFLLVHILRVAFRIFHFLLCKNRVNLQRESRRKCICFICAKMMILVQKFFGLWRQFGFQMTSITSNELNNLRWPQRSHVAIIGLKWPQMASNGLHWPQMTSIGLNWPKMTFNGLKWPHWPQVGQDEYLDKKSILGIVCIFIF